MEGEENGHNMIKW